jgi:mannose-1-phosphate guanylyltransferase/mannose-1-phosphate guanylyltransferase/mannose-6-phosphate isomerase
MVKATKKLFPVILSGGSGTRLWPLSRAAFPKQLLKLHGDASMLQETIQRASGLRLDDVEVRAPILVCNEDHRFLVREQCAAIGCEPTAIYLEPAARNTAPAIALAALHVSEALSDPDALLLILPSDHVVGDNESFGSAISAALGPARADHLVVFGVPPSRAETGYGYIRIGGPLAQFRGAHSVQEFVEKPARELAEAFLKDGKYAWNSGMFVFPARKFISELQFHRPEMLEAVTDAWRHRVDDLGFVRIPKPLFEALPNESIDYAVMQQAAGVVVVPAQFKWSDVGSWESLWQISGKDARENTLEGDVFAEATSRSYVRAESRLVAVIGLDNVVVVETPDAVLVMDKSCSQDVKLAVEHFRRTGRREHLEHVRVYRPWGWYEGIDAGERFQVKRIMVRPGDKLSLQMHHHRAEHWVVVSGTAKVTVNGVETLLTENQSTYIPVGHTHRLENPGKIPLHLVEVQSGTYLGEDDIVRLDDRYGRTGN